MGGYEGAQFSSYKKTVMSASIPWLLETCLQSSPTQWQDHIMIPDVPNNRSTVASLGGCLLVVGGVTSSDKSKSVHAYCPFTSSWVLVGKLPQPLHHCITATLPTGELLVIGGVTSSGEATNTTYKCSLSMPMQ